jgi:predicted dehydrogenase
MVRVGLAGLGFMGGTHAQCHAALPNAELVAVVDVEPDRREKFAETYGAKPFASLEEMLSSVEVDMVDICMPTYLHRKAVEQVAAAGKQVLCEKPMALTVEDCDAMIAATKKAKVKFMIGQVLRFWPEYVVIKETLDSGRLGPIKWASATRMSPPPTWSWKEWLFDPKLSGGAVLDLHIHDLDTLQWMLGQPSKISATGVKTKRGGLDNVMTTLVGHPGGQVSFAEGSLDLAPGFPFTMGLKVDCEGGTIELNSRLTPSLLVAPAGGGIEYPEVPAIEVPTVAGAGSAGNISALGGYFVEVKYFVDCVDRGEDPIRVPAAEAKSAVALCLAATKAAETGQVVAV